MVDEMVVWFKIVNPSDLAFGYLILPLTWPR